MNQPSPRIRDLIDRFLRKQLSASELAELHAWLLLDKNNAAHFDAVNKLFQEQQALQHFSDDKLNESWRVLQSRIEVDDAGLRTRSLTVRFFQSTFLKAAAVICILVLATWQLTPEKDAPVPVAPTTVLTNGTDRNIAYVLPDSTTVWLNSNSSLEYSGDFLRSRHVRLKGEGFFDVRKRHKQNFTVETSILSIEVKGTRFNIRAYDSGHEKATLEEGEIEMTIRGVKQTYTLSPGDQITIDKKQQTVTRERVDPQNFTAWKESQLIFDNIPLGDIIARLENRFDVTITVDDSLARHERLSMTVEGEPLQEILEMIRLSSALNYTIEDDQILIHE